jgi:uncharacterized protein (TIGR03435 family)
MCPPSRMSWAFLLAGLFVPDHSSGQAGTPSEKAEFEAASVKLSVSSQHITSMVGGPGTSDPGRVAFREISLRNLLSQAYDVGYDAIEGPDWLGSVWVDVVATLPRGTTKAPFRSMLVHLLEDRFSLVAHLGSKEASGYALQVAAGGPRLHLPNESEQRDDNFTSEAGQKPGAVDQDGFPLTPPGPGIHKVCIVGACRFRAESATMEELALSMPCRCPVVNETSLTGHYSFTLTADVSRLTQAPSAQEEVNRLAESGILPPEIIGRRGESFPDILRAVQIQLGLKLVRKRVAERILIIDHIEKAPSEN